MSRIDENNNLTLPTTHRARLLKGQQSIDFETESEASSGVSNKQIQHTMDNADVGCIITCIHRHTDQMAHIINAQRDDPNQKQDVEDYLVAYRIAPLDFDLNDLSNLIWMDMSLHCAFDRYGFFVIVPSESCATELQKLLTFDNTRRQQFWYDNPHLSSPPPRLHGAICPTTDWFLNPELELAILYPHQFLPGGIPLLRREESSNGPLFRSYILSEDGVLRDASDPGRIFRTFHYECDRPPGLQPNAYFFVLNAAFKFETFQRRHPTSFQTLPEHTKNLISLTFRVKALLFQKLIRPSSPNSPSVSSAKISRPRRQPPVPARLSEDDSTSDEGVRPSTPVPAAGRGGSRRNRKSAFFQHLSTLQGQEAIDAGMDLLFGKQIAAMEANQRAIGLLPPDNGIYKQTDAISDWAEQTAREGATNPICGRDLKVTRNQESGDWSI